MPPFSFPDPSVQSQVVNPANGDIWIFRDGVWMVADPNDPDGYIDINTPVVCEPAPVHADDAIAALRAEMETLRTDIIDLKAQLVSASVNNFIILE